MNHEAPTPEDKSPLREASGVKAYLERVGDNSNGNQEGIEARERNRRKPIKSEEDSGFQKLKKGSRKINGEYGLVGKEKSKNLTAREERYKKIDSLEERVATMELEASEKVEEQEKLADLKRDLLTHLSDEAEDLLADGEMKRRTQLIEGIDRLRNSFNSDPEKGVKGEHGKKYVSKYFVKQDVDERFPNAFNLEFQKTDNIIDIKKELGRPLEDTEMIDKLKAENIRLTSVGNLKQVEKNLDRIAKLSLSLLEKRTEKRNRSEDQKAA